MTTSVKPAASGKPEPKYLPNERVTAFEVHPLAAKYVMMSDDKLDALAADIAKPTGGRRTGQLHPVIIRRHGKKYQTVDGRNRLEACRRAGVDVLVLFEDLDDEAAVDRIISLNSQRRQLSHKQQAEAAWEFYRARKEVPGWKGTQDKVAKMFGISLRTFQKWRPGGIESENAEQRRGNNNNRFPIDFRYRQLCYMLSKLMLKPMHTLVNRDEVLSLKDTITRLYAAEFPSK